jgi:hypothetical protein
MNEPETSRPVSRREAFASAGRWLGVAAAASIAVLLGRRTLQHQAEGKPVAKSCSRKGNCPACNETDTCILPWAKAHRSKQESTGRNPS